MNKNSLGALVLLNLVLLAALLVVTFTPPQTAQAQARGLRGDYVMIAGSVTGRNDVKMIYILETKSLKLAAITFNSRNNKLDVIDGRALLQDMNAPIRPGSR